jgi:hypothetical protein
LLRIKHIESFKKGWPNGGEESIVSNIWFRLWQEVHRALEDLPCWSVYIQPKVSFNPIKWTPMNNGDEKETGFILFDYTVDTINPLQQILLRPTLDSSNDGIW